MRLTPEAPKVLRDAVSMACQRLGLSLLFSLAAAAQSPTVVTISATSHVSFTEALSTSFQAAPWTDAAFASHPEVTSLLDQLNPHHIRVQVIDASIPQLTPATWDFTALDRQLQPILSSADHSPEIQLANAPAFLYKSKTDFVTPAFIAGYAAYAAGMVAHYNAPGQAHPIRFWGILNEPNYFHISPAEYVAIYNAAVPIMLAMDPTIHVVALELGGEPSDERRFLPTFVRGVKVQVDVVGIHFYSTCEQRDTDQTLFNTVPNFARQIRYVRQQLNTTKWLRAVPIWITENNVNSDFVGPIGKSVCNPSEKFVEDPRGSSAFFPAWRAYEFSRLGQAGAQALFHWVFLGDQQYAEYNTEDSLAHLQLGYWTDLWLGRYYPPTVDTHILNVDNPDPSTLEVMAVDQPGRVVLLIANHAIVDSTANNAAGIGRKVTLILSAFHGLTSATLITIDADTNPSTGPDERSIEIEPRTTIFLKGYGLTLLAVNKAATPPVVH